MVLLGVTGGIGMGKSASGELIAGMGIPWVDADAIARDVALPGSEAVTEIVRTFGPQVVDETGALRRDRLAARIFPDPELRRRLEEILHPRISAVWRRSVENWRRQRTPIAAVVIPLLYEKTYESEFSRIICLACTDATQRRRLQERGWSVNQIRMRNAAQMPVVDKMARADFVVWTEGSLGCLRSQWMRILGRFEPATCSPA